MNISYILYKSMMIYGRLILFFHVNFGQQSSRNNKQYIIMYFKHRTGFPNTIISSTTLVLKRTEIQCVSI